MKLSEVRIHNFRLLKDITIALNKTNSPTVLVGPNNSGKTSVADAFYIFVTKSQRSISIHDFNVDSIKEFEKTEKSILEKEDPDLDGSIYEFPLIYIELYFDYENSSTDIAVASDLLMDLDPKSNQVALRISYEVGDGIKLAKDFRSEREDNQSLYSYLSNKLRNYYTLVYYKIAPEDNTTIERIDDKLLDALIRIDFIWAQRHIDDKETSRSTRLSHLLHEYFDKQYRHAEPDSIAALEGLLKTEVDKLGTHYEKVFKDLVDNLKNFGYPNKQGPSMFIRAELAANTLFKDYTQIFYGDGGDSEADPDFLRYELPEKYNGLGYKNLIYMILQVQSFRIALKQKSSDVPRVHIILIEEPEIHLHPQIQTVVMKNITEFLARDQLVNCQIIITTHSSNMIADSDFSPIRYFSKMKRSVSIKDLKVFQKDLSEEQNINFLRKYMTQMRCDLFFSHKAILVEGQVERILLPKMIKIFAEREVNRFDREYITIMDIGGAYAHKFEKFLKFLGIPTLIITDIDSVDNNGNACSVKDGTKTCNPMLVGWIPRIDILADLIKAEEAIKIDGPIRVAYQVAENENQYPGRTFEESFIYKNSEWIIENKEKLLATKNKFNKFDAEQLVQNASTLQLNKVNFALDLLNVDGWEIPRYIEEGIAWLAEVTIKN